MLLESRTDVGIQRDHNEDGILVTSFSFREADKAQQYYLAVLSDGMGGAAAGEVASALTIDTVVREVYLSLLEAHMHRDQNYVNLRRILYHAVERANERVYTAARENQSYYGMGATVIASIACQGRIYFSHVGDSRAYRFRDGELRQITEDHSFVNELMREGRITAEEARNHPRKNVITRAIGSRQRVKVDSLCGLLHPGDIYLLCSDGLSGMIEDRDIQAVLARYPKEVPQLIDLSRELIERANQAGGADNVSVELMAVEASDIPEPLVDQVALDPSKVLTWDEAAQLGIADLGFVEVHEG
ncbi:MAG: Stp1/IreP family PP2C-type Ser/Thr phosphatase [Candidatus Riflebacteria bacterium]|nr:Stp1/IreP family PP2C-type Ser/Thr phosphatase [Candidatus Riflebacteria bacterium]